MKNKKMFFSCILIVVLSFVGCNNPIVDNIESFGDINVSKETGKDILQPTSTSTFEKIVESTSTLSTLEPETETTSSALTTEMPILITTTTVSSTSKKDYETTEKLPTNPAPTEEYQWIIQPSYEYNDINILAEYYVWPESENFEYLFYIPCGNSILIDHRELAVDPLYDKYDYYNGNTLTGLYVVEKDGKQGLISQDGKIILNPEFDLVYSLYYLAALKNGKAVSFTNDFSILDDYTSIAPPWWIDNIYDINTGKIYLTDFASTAEENFIGVVISAEIDYTSELSEGRYTKWDTNVPGGGKYGLANNGKLVVPCEYDGFLSDYLDRISGTVIKTVEDDRIVFFKNNKIYIFDQNGVCYSNGVYDKIDNYNQELYFLNGYLPVCRNGKWGLIDIYGNEVVTCQFEDITSVYNGNAWAKEKGKWGLLKIVG